MKVKELIEKLQTLDQEKNIWVNYDLYELQEPNFRPYHENAPRYGYEDGKEGLNEGDYVHDAY